MKRRARFCPLPFVETPKNSPPNAYVMAVFTAGLAAAFSLVGGYSLAALQSEKIAIQRLHERRSIAYETFLQRIGAVPGVGELLGTGAMVRDLMTDSELDMFEDRSAKLLQAHGTQDLYWRLNAEMQVLHLHGTPRVREICDDILKLLVLRHDAVRWSRYSPETRVFYQSSLGAQESGSGYGVTEQLTEDERLMILMTPLLTQVLVEQLRTELLQPSN